ncbi:MAG TPA: hypothetical protein VM939_06990 [Gemmatimonadaceae bacterium]|nr:hypothetical protein [Gemmatimonadaceae bacterium]
MRPTLGEWIASREPAPPPALTRRMKEAIDSLGDDGGSTRFDSLITAATRILRTLPDDRGAALALLAADALITYAFESAAEECDALSARADDAIRRIASLT